MLASHHRRAASGLSRLLWPCSSISTPRRLQQAILLGAAVCALLGLAWLARFLGTHIHLRHEFTWYDIGFHGVAPTHRYRSFDKPVATIEWLRRDARCSDELILLGPKGARSVPGALILRPDGEPIWRQEDPWAEEVQDVRVQEFKGELFLTFWAGKEAGGRKEGLWYMLDETYQIRHEIAPTGHETGDLHEFHITQDDTALITVYNPVQWDLSPIGGPSDGWLLDSIFQEIDIDTGDVLFQWNASAHVPVESTYKTRAGCSHLEDHAFAGCGVYEHASFDYYHMNSIEKDAAGNFLISGRNVFTLTYVDGETGEILWNLGGKDNEFEDLSDGEATRWAWQHFARFHDNGTSISLFDNEAKAFDLANPVSRGLIIDIDVDALTAELRREYPHPQELKSFSQGSLLMMEDAGTVFVGWGRSAAFTEFTAEGEVLCDARFGAMALFDLGTAQSYRAHRAVAWVGRPETKPSAVAEGGSVYVSWNGATEVDTWQLDGTLNADEEKVTEGFPTFEVVSTAQSTGFETEISATGLDLNSYPYVRVTALDADGNVLGHSDVFNSPAGRGLMTPRTILFLAALGLVAAAGVTLWAGWRLCCGRRRSRRKGASVSERQGYKLVGDVVDDERSSGSGSGDGDVVLHGVSRA